MPRDNRSAASDKGIICPPLCVECVTEGINQSLPVKDGVITGAVRLEPIVRKHFGVLGDADFLKVHAIGKGAFADAFQ